MALTKTNFDEAGRSAQLRPLSARESEVLSLLATGLSGTAIAERLVLSPETVRTHVRNAMEKLQATTRSQAVAIALERGDIGERDRSAAARTAEPEQVPGGRVAPSRVATLRAFSAGLASIADIAFVSMYLLERDGLTLRLSAESDRDGPRPTSREPVIVPIGQGRIGRVALESRTELVSDPSSGLPLIAAPMSCDGRLAGVICISSRPSRPTDRRELLLVEALGTGVANALEGTGEIGPTLKVSLERFRAAWVS